MGAGTLTKRKRPSGRGTWGVHLLGEDAVGTWLFTPQGSKFHAETDEGPLVCFAGVPQAPGVDVLQLVPRQGWWVAHWKVIQGVRSLSVDICQPATRVGDAWTYEDLELDLHQEGAAPAELFDKDEFDDAVAAGLIDPGERAACLEAAEDLLCRIADGDEVLTVAPWRRLARAVAAGFPACP